MIVDSGMISTAASVWVNVKVVVLGMVGGLVGTMFLMNKAKKEHDTELEIPFSFVLFNTCMGGFVAYIVVALIPPEAISRETVGAVGGLVGIFAYQIIEFAEKQIPSFLSMVADKFLGNKK